MIAVVQNIRGMVTLGCFTINTIVWFIPLLLLSLLKLLMPFSAVRNFITRLLMRIGENWVSVNSLIIKLAASVDIDSQGLDDLQRDGWYLVIANHQTWIDIIVLQAVFNRRVPFLKFFLKQELIWFPLLGIAWWAMDMPFMKRYSPSFIAKNPHMKGKDLETTRNACKKFRDSPTAVLNFLEGTRFSEEKRNVRKSPYRHLLQPRAGGLAVALSSMGELFTSIVDVTVVYPEKALSFWEMCCGHHVRVIVIVREIPLADWLFAGDYQNDRAYRRQLHTWLGDIWAEKDEILGQTRAANG